MSEVTQILNAIDGGDPNAVARLLPLVYEELRRLAAAQMARVKQMRTPEMIRLTQAVERLVKFYEASGNGAKADAWRKKVTLETLPLPRPLEPK